MIRLQHRTGHSIATRAYDSVLLPTTSLTLEWWALAYKLGNPSELFTYMMLHRHRQTQTSPPKLSSSTTAHTRTQLFTHAHNCPKTHTTAHTHMHTTTLHYTRAQLLARQLPLAHNCPHTCAQLPTHTCVRNGGNVTKPSESMRGVNGSWRFCYV